MRFPDVVLPMPAWVARSLPGPEQVFASVEERMRLVVELSRLNVAHGTGGPFGAGVFERETGRLLSVGVNVVVAARCSIAHAEIVAIGTAQQMFGRHDLGCEGTRSYELVSSTEPCAMCLGAVVWSGVRALVCGARDADARAVGFDEGPKPSDWVQSLKARGIAVARDILRQEARQILSDYAEAGGPIYNPRRQGV